MLFSSRVGNASLHLLRAPSINRQLTEIIAATVGVHAGVLGTVGVQQLFLTLNNQAFFS